MFTYLLRRFSDEVARAADNVGAKELAEKIRSEALLAKPNALSKYIPFNENLVPLFADKIKLLGRDIMKSPRKERMPLVYEMAKAQIFDLSGVGSLEEIGQLRQKIKDMRDPAKYMQVEETEDEPIEEPDVETVLPNERWINSDALLVLSLLLYFLNQQIQ